MTRLVLALLATGLLCAAPGFAEVVLVQDGQNPWPVYLYAGASNAEKSTAARFAAYLQQMSGAAFTIAALPDPAPERGVFLHAPDPALESETGADGFIIATSAARVSLSAPRALGLQYAVYALLERLGCRFWSWNEETIPSKPTLTLPANERVVIKPPFSLHDLYNREAQTGENGFLHKSRATSSDRFTGGHSLYPLLTPYAKTHPEIYPMNDKGERKANDLHFCYLAPGISEALAEALEKQVVANQGNVRDFIYFAGMGDWYGGMCQCPLCKPVYEEEAWTDPDGKVKLGYTGTLLRMINRTAEILEEKYPGIRVGTFAYMSLEAPPSQTVPRDNVVLWIPRLRHCTVHPAETCPQNLSYRRNLERWCELAPGRVYVWEYGASFSNFLCPFPCTNSMAENLRYYARTGVRGVSIQGNYVSMGGDLCVLRNWVWSRLMWNPALDTAALIREFCEGYYGPAGEAMLAYVNALEASVTTPALVHADEFAPVDKYLSPDAAARLAELRAQALALVPADSEYLRRVKEGTVGVEVRRLWTAGAFREENDRLVRADLGEYTVPAALDLLAHIRNASIREWGSGRSYHRSFMTLQGGPLYTLGEGEVQAKIAPLIGGQLRRLLFQGRDLLYVEGNPAVKGYPTVGGSLDNVGVYDFNLVGEASATRVRIEGESGIGGWSPNTKQLIWKTFDVQGNTVDVLGTVRQMPGGVAERGDVVSTVWLADKNAAGMGAQYEVGEGEWVPLHVEPGKTVDLPTLRAVRLRFPEKGCEVTDRYLAPAVTNAKVTYTPAQGTITVVVTTAAVPAPLEGEAPFLHRQIEVLPLGG